MAPKRKPKNPQPAEQNQGVGWLNQKQRQQVVQAHISATYSGPLPPPEILARYNDAVPGAAERILAMAERQSTHRMQLENQVVIADIQRANRGLLAGFIIALAFGAGSLVLVLSGHEVVGAIIGGADLVALVGTFVYGTESRRRERQQRAAMFDPED